MPCSRFPLWCPTQISPRGNEEEASAFARPPATTGSTGGSSDEHGLYSLFSQPVPRDRDSRVCSCELCLCVSKQFEPCSCCHVSCTLSHHTHTSACSGVVSIRGLAAESDWGDAQTQGWLTIVTTSLRRQDGGDGVRPLPSTSQTAAAELSQGHRLARDSSNGKPHPTVFFATPAERGCQTSSSRQFGDPSSSASATESQCIVDSGSRLRRACALSDCRRSGHSGGSSIVSQPTHSLSELWEGLQPLAKGTSNHRERLQAPTLISPTSHPSHPLFSSGRRLEVDSPRRDCRSPPQGCDRASAQGTKHARLLLEVLCREQGGGGMRPILDLRGLNVHLRKAGFKLLTCQSLLGTVRHRDCLRA